MLLIAVQAIVLGMYGGLTVLLSSASLLLDIFVVYSCISLKDLIRHGKAVWHALEQENLEKARNAVKMLIGRDANKLDSCGVARAAVESLAENFVDGFLAPLFWLTLGTLLIKFIGWESMGLAVGLALCYRVTNTLDSMVGYKNERYREFGTASAKLDDWLNFLPARLGIPMIALAALFCRLDARQAWQIGWRDRLKHSSPNAGHTEAAVAGALQVKLNGPGIYPFGRVDKPWLGDGTEQVTARHLQQTFYLIVTAALIATAFFAITIALL